MALQQRPESKSAYVPPITCECGGNAHLIRIRLDPLKSTSGAELRTFQCYSCRQLIEVTVEP